VVTFRDRVMKLIRLFSAKNAKFFIHVQEQ